MKRSMALAGLFGAAVLLSPLAASADAMVSHHHHHHAASAQRMETVEQRIDRLHASLQITAAQETSWTAVAQVMRDNEVRMQGMRSAQAAEPAGQMNAVEDLKTYERFTQAHVTGLKTLISSFETLYDTMPDSQKRIADQVFQKFHHRHES